MQEIREGSPLFFYFDIAVTLFGLLFDLFFNFYRIIFYQTDNAPASLRLNLIFAAKNIQTVGWRNSIHKHYATVFLLYVIIKAELSRQLGLTNSCAIVHKLL